jgi:hypothetical protein
MTKVKVKNRDLYLLLIGVLFAFFIQVAYEIANELVNGKTDTIWFGAQVGIFFVVGLGTWYLLSKIEVTQ